MKVCIALLGATAGAAPGFPSLSFDAFHGAPLLPAPVFKAALPAPVLAPAPIYAPAPIFKAAPVIAAPVVKAVAPATSYATVTQVHVTHPAAVVKVAQPILKTVVAPEPIIAQPILKSFALPAPALHYGHGYGFH